MDYDRADRDAVRVMKWGGAAIVGALALVGVGALLTGGPKSSTAVATAPSPATSTAIVNPLLQKQTDAPSPPQSQSAGDLDYLTLKAEAEEKLDDVLSDSSGVRYRNVQTRLTTTEGGGIVAFCGEENSKTPEGGYGGFKRFIASRSVATTEDGMPPDDFEQGWGRFCTDGVKGPHVWF